MTEEAGQETRLLLVDDSRDHLSVLEEIITRRIPECTVLTATSAAEGLYIASSTPVSAGLIDVEMPGMDGIEMCRRLKTDPATADIPVILVTAHRAEASLKARGLEAGADDFISKPIDNVELAARIKILLRTRKAEEELRIARDTLADLLAQRTDAWKGAQALLHAIVEGTTDPVFLKDAVGRYVLVNSAALRVMGKLEEDVIGRDDRDIFSSRPAAELMAIDQDIMSSGRAHVVENTTEVDGKKTTWLSTRTPHRDPRGNVIGLIGMARDITERKQAEEALREGEQRFRGMFESISSGVAVFNAVDEGEDFVFVDFNPAGERIEKVGREDVVGKRVTVAFPSIEEFGLLQVLRRVWRTGEPEHSPVSFYKDERIEGWRDNYVYRLPSGEVVAVYNDLTAEKQAEEEIRDLAKFPAENPDPVLRVAKDGTLLYANAASEPLQAEWRCEVGQPVPESWRNMAAEALASRSAKRIQVDCGQRIFAFRVAPVADAGYVNLYARDITEQRSVEEQLRQAQKMEAIGHLAGGVAHDFRNQLTVINGYAEMLLRREQLEENAQRMVQEILNASARSQSLTTSLLAFSRKQILQPETVDVCQVVSDLSGALQRMIGEDFHLSIELKAPSAYALLDRGYFEQGLFNLITNARDAMPKGGELSVTVTETDLDDEFAKHHVGATVGPNVLISVRDTGSGMDEDTRNRIFEPFFTTKPVGMGTGLGLSMLYGFVKQSHGHITVDSAPGEGAEFRLYFPRADASSGPQKAGEMSGTLLGGSGTILVVEDEESVRLMVTETLRECGYTVLECGLGREAMEIVARHAGRVEMLITDVIMPEMDGVDLAAHITKRHPEIQVLYMSGYGGEALQKHDMPRSDHDLLRKPFHARELLAKVQAALGPQTP